MMPEKRMQRLHGDSEAYWRYQREYAQKTLLPILASWGWNPKGKKVLEIGCSEAGILQEFSDAGADVEGIELSQARVNSALKLQKSTFAVRKEDICSEGIVERLNGPYDFILLRDVIEHLFQRDIAFQNLKDLLSPNGKVLVTFPPWYMPFGGHQQVLKNGLRKVPWLHLLPLHVYRRMITRGTEGDESLRQDLLNTRATGLTIRGFTRLLQRTGFEIEREIRWLVNPAYEIKFGLKRRKAGIVGNLPGIREFAVTSIYALLKPSDKRQD